MQNEPVTRERMLEKIETSWTTLQSLLSRLNEHQMTVPTDAAGWTVKDHLAHLIAWEASLLALLEGQSRPEAMGMDAEVFASHDHDRMNAQIQERNRDLSLAAGVERLNSGHARVVARVAQMTDADLQRPYSDFDPTPPYEPRPIFAWIVGDTFGHYEEHIPWIATIALP